MDDNDKAKKVRKSRMSNAQSNRYHYYLYGLVVCSDRRLPLKTISQTSDIDLTIECGLLPRHLAKPEVWVSSQRYGLSRQDNKLSSQLYIQESQDGLYVLVHFFVGCTLVFSQDGKKLWVKWRRDKTFTDTLPILLGFGFGFLLALRQQVGLHASAVQLDEGVVAFIGPSRTGKSSLAAYFVEQGAGLLSDDIAVLRLCKDVVMCSEQDNPALNDKVVILPNNVGLRLRRDSIDYFQPDYEIIISQKNNRQIKNIYDVDTDAQQIDTRELKAIFVLSPPSDDDNHVMVEHLSGLECFQQLANNTYLTELMFPHTIRQKRMNMIAHVAKSVPVFRLIRSGSLTILPDVYRHVKMTLNQL